MLELILFSGVGGQGVLMAGTVLAQVCIKEGLHCSSMPNYGLEMRGGQSKCWVAISDEAIPSPVFSHPTSAIFVSDRYMQEDLPNISPGGLILVNAPEEDTPPRTAADIYYIRAGDIAREQGSSAANMVLLGAYLQAKNTVSLSAVIDHLKETTKREDLLIGNINCLKAGAAWQQGVLS